MYRTQNFADDFDYIVSEIGDAFIYDAKWDLKDRWEDSLGKYISLVHFYTTEEGKAYNNALKRYSDNSLILTFERLWNHSLGVLHREGKIKVHSGIVYRGSSREDNDGICNHNVGGIFTQNSLLSSSAEYSVAKEWFEDGVIINIVSATALDITPYTKHRKEAEVLFPSKTQFRVIDKDLVNANLLSIFIEEI